MRKRAFMKCAGAKQKKEAAEIMIVQGGKKRNLEHICDPRSFVKIV